MIKTSSMLCILISVVSFASHANNSCNNYLSKNDATIVENSNLTKNYSPITVNEIIEVKDIVEAIISAHPPKDSFYIGLGRSPTPVMAFFDAIGFANTKKLPLSSFHNHPRKINRESNVHRMYNKALSMQAKADLYAHFERFLPTNEDLKGKKIILIDYVQSGSSLVAAKEYLTEYYSSLGINISIFIFPMTPTDYSKIPMNNDFVVNEVIGAQGYVLNSKGALLRNINREVFEKFSEYGGFFPYDGVLPFGLKPNYPDPENRNPNYKILVASIRKHLNID